MWTLDSNTKELVYTNDDGSKKCRIAVFGSVFLLLDANYVEDFDGDLRALIERHDLPAIK